MAKFLWVKSRFQDTPPKESIFEQFKNWFFSLDPFFRSSLIVMLCVIIVTPIIIATHQIFFAHASTAITTYKINDFEGGSNSLSEWNFSSNTGSATGSLQLGSGYNSVYGARLLFNFQNSTSVSTLQMVKATRYFGSNTQPQAAVLSFWAKSPMGVRVTVGITDATGQSLEYDTQRPLEATNPSAWYPKAVKLDEPTSHSGGANDGVVHYPIQSVSIEALALDANYNYQTNNALLSGEVDFDNVYWTDLNTSIITRSINPQDTNIVPVNEGFLTDNISTGVHGDLTATKVSELQQTGVKRARIDLCWDCIEQTKGNYNWSYFDTYVSQLQSIGVKPLFILDYGNHNYFSPIQTSAGQDYGDTSALGISGFTTFAQKAASHFNSTIPGQFMFEVWNEPHNLSFWYPGVNASQYATLESATVQAIQSLNLNIPITTAGFAHDFSYLKSYRAANPSEHANDISLHPYRQNIPETISDDYFFVKQLVGSSLQTIITEWGYPSDSTWWNITHTTDYLRSQAANLQILQAKMISRQLWTTAALGIQHMDQYALNDDSAAGDYFGLRDSSDNTKPAWTAFITATKFAQQFQVFGLEPTLSTALSNLHALILKNSQQYLVVVWKDGAKSNVIVSFPTAFPIASATDYMGNTASVSNNTVLVNDTPVYVLLPLNPIMSPTPTPTPSPTPALTPTSYPTCQKPNCAPPPPGCSYTGTTQCTCGSLVCGTTLTPTITPTSIPTPKPTLTPNTNPCAANTYMQPTSCQSAPDGPTSGSIYIMDKCAVSGGYNYYCFDDNKANATYYKQYGSCSAGPLGQIGSTNHTYLVRKLAVSGGYIYNCIADCSLTPNIAHCQ